MCLSIKKGSKLALCEKKVGPLRKSFLPCDKVEFADTKVCILVWGSNCPQSTLIDKYCALLHLERSGKRLEQADHELQCVSCKRQIYVTQCAILINFLLANGFQVTDLKGSQSFFQKSFQHPNFIDVESIPEFWPFLINFGNNSVLSQNSRTWDFFKVKIR